MPADDTDLLDERRAALAARLMRHVASDEMLRPPAMPDLALFRNQRPYGSVCGVYEPCVALIVQGRKRVMLGDESYTYDGGRYLIAAMDLPVLATLLEASPERPYLALALRLDWREIGALMLEMAPGAPVADRSEDERDARAMATGAVGLPLLDAFDRLLALLDQPADIPVLAPLARREIFYRLLAGETGPRLRRIATDGSQGQQVARAIEVLRTRFAESWRIEALAREAHMSVSAFHHHFKALTAMSPLQYQKLLRLTEARRLMLSEALDAATAAYRVGYESASQFSREYSRQFGAPPGRDIAALRAAEPA